MSKNRNYSLSWEEDDSSNLQKGDLTLQRRRQLANAISSTSLFLTPCFLFLYYFEPFTSLMLPFFILTYGSLVWTVERGDSEGFLQKLYFPGLVASLVICSFTSHFLKSGPMAKVIEYAPFCWIALLFSISIWYFNYKERTIKMIEDSKGKMSIE